MAAEVEIVVNATDNASSTLGNFGSIITGIESAINLAGQAFDFVSGVVGDFVNSASESEQAVAELEQVLRATGGAAGLTSQELQDMADELQGVTMFSDEAILAGQSMLLTFKNIGEDTFPRATEAMLDMGQMFGSVDAAAVQLGKALNDPIAGISALQRIGVTFSEGQREQIENFMEMGDIASAQNIILTELESQIGGVAEAMGQTFAGQMEIAKNQFDSLKETIGGAFLPVLGELLGRVTEIVNSPEVQAFVQDFAQDLSEGLESVIPFIDQFVVALQEIGNLIAAGDVTGLGEMLTNAAESVDWEGFSQSLAAGIESIDWGRVGNIVAEGLGHIAIAIGTVLGEIDWSALLNSLGNAFADLVAGLFGFIDWEDMIASAEVGFRYVGDAIVDGLRSGLQAAWTNFTNLPNLLFNNFITSIKTLLGISSPSSVFASIGRDIVNGLILGFNAAWDTLMDIAGNALEDFMAFFGIDLSGILGGTSASGLGTAGGGTAPDTGTSSTGGNTYNIYGTSYWGFSSPDGLNDCPSPHPLVAASGNQLVTTGF